MKYYYEIMLLFRSIKVLGFKIGYRFWRASIFYRKYPSLIPQLIKYIEKNSEESNNPIYKIFCTEFIKHLNENTTSCQSCLSKNSITHPTSE